MTLDPFIKSDENTISQATRSPKIVSTSNITLKRMQKVLDTLKVIENKYDKQFNFTRLARQLKIPAQEVPLYVSLILGFQELTNTVFQDYLMHKKIANNTTYLLCKPKKEDSVSFPREVRLSQKEVTLLNDLSYYFKYIKRGKPFEISESTNDVLKSLASLTISHPFLFKMEGDKIYLSEIGLELGSTINTYKKNNKKLETATIQNYTFRFE